MPQVADRVFETTLTQGTNALQLLGAQSGFQAFRDAFNTNDEVFYLIEQTGGDWEVGRGTLTEGSPDQLSRDTIISSSSGGGAVNFGTGTKNVFGVMPGAELNQFLSNTPRLDQVNTYTQRQVIDTAETLLLDFLDTKSDRKTAGDLHRWRSFGLNDGDAEVEYAGWRSRILSAAAGAHAGELSLFAYFNAAAADVLHLARGLYTPNAIGGDPGPDSLNLKGLQVDGIPVLTPLLLDVTTISSSQASYSFTWDNALDWQWLSFFLANWRADTLNATLQARTSSDGGVSHDSGAADYHFAGDAISSAGRVSNVSNGASAISFTRNRVSNVAGEFASGRIDVELPDRAAPVATKSAFLYETGGIAEYADSKGRRLASADVDGIEIFFSGAALIEEGHVIAVGWR